MKKLLVLLLMAVTVTSSLVGCGSGGSGTNSSSEGSNSSDISSTNGSVGVKGLISVVSREDGSGTRGAFVELFGIEEKDSSGNRTDHTTTEAIIANSTEIVLSNVAGNPNAIGYVSLGSLKDSVKALQINGVAATVENIKNGSYEIARPFNIATNDSPNEATQDFIHFIMSTEGQSVVEEAGYIQAVDAPNSFESTHATGKIVIAGSSSVSPVMEKLIEAYNAINPNATIELQTNDSTTGLQAVLDGTAHIGMASRDLKDSESSLSATVIAMDGIVVVVNQANTTETLTPAEVKAIFTGETTIW